MNGKYKVRACIYIYIKIVIYGKDKLREEVKSSINLLAGLSLITDLYSERDDRQLSLVKIGQADFALLRNDRDQNT